MCTTDFSCESVNYDQCFITKLLEKRIVLVWFLVELPQPVKQYCTIKCSFSLRHLPPGFLTRFLDLLLWVPFGKAPQLQCNVHHLWMFLFIFWPELFFSAWGDVCPMSSSFLVWERWVWVEETLTSTRLSLCCRKDGLDASLYLSSCYFSQVLSWVVSLSAKSYPSVWLMVRQNCSTTIEDRSHKPPIRRH